MSTVQRATIADLYRTEGQAELIGGKICQYPPAGYLPGVTAGRISIALEEYADRTGRGEAFTATLAYVVPEMPSGRESFSPDASYHLSPWPENPMAFIDGAPTFAVEVRGEGDFGPAADAAYVAKREDYFQAGTLVVWDVDPLARTIRCYRGGVADTPAAEFRVGDTADAEPAVPGWRLDVQRLFA